MMRLEEIHVRDPFVLTIESEGKYYMYGTPGETAWKGKPAGFDVYISEDLENWEGPHPAFVPEPDFWADQNFWAPEVHPWKGKYYMFASFKAEGRRRGTQTLVADHPLGPFRVQGDGPVTPSDWECLDGTFYKDENDRPWMIFCHEWVQIGDGEICAVRLNDDLDTAVTEPIVLFRASEASWAQPIRGGVNYVTDGPFLYRSKRGELLMLWSSFGQGGYAIGSARSTTGCILGPWIQDDQPVYEDDGGHGMLFHSLDGKLFLSIHTPNEHPLERPVFISMLG